MACLLAGVKSYSEQDPKWASHPLVMSIWQAVNEERRAKRQGRQSAPQNPQMGAQTTGQVPQAGGGGQLVPTNAAPGKCFKCGGPGHRATMCPIKGPRGRMQMVGHSQLWVS